MNEGALKQAWLRYQSSVAEGRQPSFFELGIPVGPETSRNFAGLPTASARRVRALVLEWEKRVGAHKEERDREISDEQKILEMGLQFLRCAAYCRVREFTDLLDAGVPVNFQHPRSLLTALHYTTTQDTSNELTRVLMAHPEIDLLIRECHGRQAWNNAEFFGIDPTLATELRDASAAQAAAEGIDIFAEYREHLKDWISTAWYERLAARREGPGLD